MSQNVLEIGAGFSLGSSGHNIPKLKNSKKLYIKYRYMLFILIK